MRISLRLLFSSFILALLVFCTFLRCTNRQYINIWNIEIQTEGHSKDYCVAYNVVSATEKFRNDGLEPVSLAIHGTADHLKEVERLANTWDGPISLSLFVDSFSSYSVQHLYYLHQCVPVFREKLTLHVVYRKSAFQQSCFPIYINITERECGEFLKSQSEELKTVAPPFQIYPINVMRNIARIGAASDIHMTVDIDMEFSQGFATKIKPIANQYINGKDKNLLVIRRFEVKEKEKMPRNHDELQKLMFKNKAFEFHAKFFPAGHTIKALPYWFKQSQNLSDVKAWEMEYKNSEWEAQLILHRNDPYNADYFPTRIRDQQCLVYELCRANYKFNIVSHVFNFHRGIKSSETEYSREVLKHQKRFKKKAFDRFIASMDHQYPKTSKKCGNFIM